MKKILFIATVISIPIIILLSSLFYFALDLDYYQNYYHNHNTYSKFSESPHEIDNITNNLISYIGAGNGDLAWFSDKEQLHMKDVKNLFNVAKWTLNFALLVLIISLVTIYN